MDADTGQITWRYDLGGACVSTPGIVDGHIYIGNATGTFFCFGPWRRFILPSTSACGIAFAPQSRATYS